MRMFFGMILAATVFSTGAAAQSDYYTRYNEMLSKCPHYAAANLQPANRDTDADAANALEESRWARFIQACVGNEARVKVPMQAPANTLVDAPSGEPKRTFKRPATAPKGVYYRCNPRTYMPDPASTKICGPLPAKTD